LLHFPSSFFFSPPSPARIDVLFAEAMKRVWGTGSSGCGLFATGQPSSITRGEKYAAICQSQQICFVRKILRAQEMRIFRISSFVKIEEDRRPSLASVVL
jgi:hypothetical protein